jgi:hypothetical protein
MFIFTCVYIKQAPSLRRRYLLTLFGKLDRFINVHYFSHYTEMV